MLMEKNKKIEFRIGESCGPSLNPLILGIQKIREETPKLPRDHPSKYYKLYYQPQVKIGDISVGLETLLPKPDYKKVSILLYCQKLKEHMELGISRLLLLDQSFLNGFSFVFDAPADQDIVISYFKIGGKPKKALKGATHSVFLGYVGHHIPIEAEKITKKGWGYHLDKIVEHIIQELGEGEWREAIEKNLRQESEKRGIKYKVERDFFLPLESYQKCSPATISEELKREPGLVTLTDDETNLITFNLPKAISAILPVGDTQKLSCFSQAVSIIEPGLDLVNELKNKTWEVDYKLEKVMKS